MWLINIIVIKLKIILMLVNKLFFKKYFQYIKTCLWLGQNALKGVTSITLH
jgi:hypothetical protein